MITTSQSSEKLEEMLSEGLEYLSKGYITSDMFVQYIMKLEGCDVPKVCDAIKTVLENPKASIPAKPGDLGGDMNALVLACSKNNTDFIKVLLSSKLYSIANIEDYFSKHCVEREGNVEYYEEKLRAEKNSYLQMVQAVQSQMQAQ